MSKLTDELEALVKRYSWNKHQPFFDDGQAQAFERALQLAREHAAASKPKPIAEAETGWGNTYLVWDDDQWKIAAYGMEYGKGWWFDDSGRPISNDAVFLPLPPPPEPKP